MAHSKSGDSGRDSERSLKPCPHCSSAIPAAATICASCGVDLTTGQPVRLGSGMEPVTPAPGERVESGSTRQRSTVIRLSKPPATANEAAEVETKPCISCGVPLPVQLVLCPACGTDQQKAISRLAEAQRRSKSRKVRAAVGFLLVVLVLSGLSIAGYVYRVPIRDRMEAWRAAPKVTRRAAPVPAARAVSSTGPRASAKKPRAHSPKKVKAVCTLCNGEGYYMRNPTDRESCPVCRRSGSRMVTLREGTKLCPSCRGIGRVEEKPRGSPSRVSQGIRKRARKCERCQGSGIVRTG